MMEQRFEKNTREDEEGKGGEARKERRGNTQKEKREIAAKMGRESRVRLFLHCQ